MRLFVAALALAVAVPAAAATDAAAGSAWLLDIDRDINAVTATFVADTLRAAGEGGARLVVVRLNTPGGRLDSTREITQAILGSKVPVIGYVSPPGAQAASAGFLVLMACDVAAMATGTNTGSASPVGSGGEELPKTLGKKITEDASALVRSLVGPRGRPEDLAIKAVTEAVSYSDKEALEKKLVEVVARDLPDLLAQLDGRTVKRVGGPDVVLKTAGLGVDERRMTPMQRALGVIASPTVAALLLLLGLVGIYAEMQNPGAVFPGVIGGISLLLALFALSVLPTNWAAIGLLLLGVLFFFLEVKLTAHGLFAIGGGIAMILGAVLLFHRDELSPKGDLWFVVGFAATTSLILAGLSLKALAIQRLPQRTGAGALVGQVVPVREAIAETGWVFVDGALWEARAEKPVEAGELAEVVAVEGLRVVIRPVKGRRET